MSVTRSELIKRVASANGLADREVAAALTAMIKTITEGLEDGCRIEVRGFGSLNPQDREPHMARNPRTGDKVEVGTKRWVRFKAGKQLQALVNGDHDALLILREKQDRKRRLRDARAGQLSLF